jgi:hypothetical protein
MGLELLGKFEFVFVSMPMTTEPELGISERLGNTIVDFETIACRFPNFKELLKFFDPLSGGSSDKK